MSSAGTFCSLQYSAQTSPNGIVFNSSARIIKDVKSCSFCSFVSSSVGCNSANNSAFCTLRKPVTHAPIRLMDASK